MAKSGRMLGTQRVRRRRRKSPRIFLYALLSTGLAGAIYWAIPFGRLAIAKLHSKATRSIPIHFSVEPIGSSTLSAADKEAVDGIIHNMALESTLDLAQLSESIQHLGLFSTVTSFRQTNDSVVIRLARRTPFVLINTDVLRLLTEDGIVYGVASQEQIASLPKVYGLFAERKQFIFASDHSLPLGESETEKIKEAILLYQTTKDQGIPLSTLEFQKFRGFFAVLAEGGTTVTFGRAPFEAKIQRLKTILTQLKAKSILSERIELDYEGKAFVKEKKM